MSWFSFTPASTYDAKDPKDLKKEIDAAYNLGYSGTPTNDLATAARTKLVADTAAMERTQGLFNKLDGNSQLHKQLRARLIEDRKWLAHHDKCIDATKRGYEKLKANAKAIVDEAVASGIAEAEKRMKAERQAQFKAMADNATKKGDGANFKSQDDKQQQNNNNKQQQNNNQNNNNNQQNGKPKPVNLIVENLVIQKKGKKDKKGKSNFKQFH